jgi:hypothetical protein
MLVNIPTHKSGDTWSGIPNISFVRKGIPLNLNGAMVRMQVRSSNDSPSVLDLSSPNSGIIITDASNGQITIPSRIIDVPAGEYKYEIQIKLANGETKTFIEGNWTITENITK